MVSTGIKRSTLRDAFDAAVTADITLYAQLRSYETSARSLISTGQQVASTSLTNGAGGSSVSFFPPGAAGLTTGDFVEMMDSLIELHDLVLVQQSLTDTTANRLAIKTEMMGLLKPCRSMGVDFTGLRSAGA